MNKKYDQGDSPRQAMHGRVGRGRMFMATPPQKAKNIKKTFLHLLHYLGPHSFPLLIVFAISICGTIFNILAPKILGSATTILFEGVMKRLGGLPAVIDFNRIGQILLLLVFIYLFSEAFSYLGQFIMAGVVQKIVFRMREETYAKLTHLPLKFFDGHTHGEILSRVINDMDLIGSTLDQSLTHLISAIVTVSGVLVMMLLISPIMTLVALVTLPLSYLVTAKIAGYSQKRFAEQQRVLGRLNGHIEETYGGHIIVKSFGNEDKAIRHFKKINDKLYDTNWRAQFVSGIIMPLLGFINNISYVLICIIGAVFVVQGKIVIGDLQAFIQYSKNFREPIVQFANIANIIQSTLAAAERVFELLDEEEERTDDEQSLVEFAPRGDISFQKVTFGYSAETTLMKDLDICIEAGQTVAVVGPTGAGKTTLVNLLMRFYEIDGGKITIDGVDIRHIERGTLRSLFGMVLQDTWLFQGTIRDNIAYGKEGATDEEIKRAAGAAHADHFIGTLPGGYNTILNEEASNISQGQKQLITIARAILADPAILILDEATSSVDTRTELLIQKAMARLMKGRTSFVIAHRLSTIRDADIILVMDEGAVVEKGTNSELLSLDGFYAALYQSRFDAGGSYHEAG
ncbi:MAG: ABC transporter ATP-binding protein [Dethiobacteria bacterium]|jgi:ATP-binding cassette subfamily B multidrug efflux pump